MDLIQSKDKIQFVKVVAPLCSCGNEIGKIQHKFESHLLETKSIASTLNHLGLTKMCCRRSFLIPPKNTVVSYNSSAYTIAVGKSVYFEPGVKIEHMTWPE